jgi:hypothetical protein
MASKDRTKAKLELRKHISSVRMVPQTTDSNGYYVAEGEWDLLAGYDGEANPGAISLGVVAGAQSVQHMHLPFRVPLIQ